MTRVLVVEVDGEFSVLTLIKALASVYGRAITSDYTIYSDSQVLRHAVSVMDKKWYEGYQIPTYGPSLLITSSTEIDTDYTFQYITTDDNLVGINAPLRPEPANAYWRKQAKNSYL